MTAGRRTVATIVIAGLGVAIGAAVLPFLFGLLGAPVLAVTFSPFHSWLLQRTGPRRAAAVVVVTGVFAVFLPAIGISLLLFSELPAVLASPDLARIIESLAGLHIGPLDFGQHLATASSDFITWLSRQAMALVSGLTFVAINLLIAFLGLYFLLRAGDEPWETVRRYIPFSPAIAERLRVRFHDLTRATILGLGATAIAQGIVVGGGFALVGLGHPLLWGAVTGVVSVLPVFGSAIVWLPAAALLLVEHRYADAAVIVAIGALIASNVDNIIRPMIFRRVGAVHPLLAVVGAFAGMRYFGLLGLLLGPLALVYFVELAKAYDIDFQSRPADVGGRPTIWRQATDNEAGSPMAS